MGYQALLFCPDEKLSRSVTQVLSELEFAVVPCTEPFAAVKKMMAERFDAVVVDCDNEQNATLLFKSARSSPNNQSSLAVAVVEGQAGVAKAFRIGANLVLTKPINVEQAKGTLRVARGLLRKNEAAKSPGATGTSPLKSYSAAPGPVKPAPHAASASAGTSVAPMAPLASVASMPLTSAVPQKAAPVAIAKTAVPAPTDIPEADVDVLDDEDEVASPATASPVSAQAPAPVAASSSPVSAKAEPIKRPTDTKPLSASAFGASTSAAPAPARQVKLASSAQQEKSSALAPSKNSVEAGRDVEPNPKTEPAGPPVSLTFGGAVGDETKTAKSGNRKLILSVAAVVLLAAAGYGAWMQWGPSSTASSVAPRPASQPPAPAPQPAEAATATPPASIPPSVAGANSTSSPQPPTTKASPDKPAASSVSTHKSRASDEAEETAAPIAETKTEQPIVIKNGAAKGKSATSDVPAPNLEGITVAAASPLPNLMVSESKTPTPVLQSVHVSQGVSQGILLKRVPPVYPPNALRLRIEGEVQLVATISPAGNVTAVKIVSGDALLAHAAADAVKQWKYKPYLLNDTPIEIQKSITVNFKLPQ